MTGHVQNVERPAPDSQACEAASARATDAWGNAARAQEAYDNSSGFGRIWSGVKLAAARVGAGFSELRADAVCQTGSLAPEVAEPTVGPVAGPTPELAPVPTEARDALVPGVDNEVLDTSIAAAIAAAPGSAEEYTDSAMPAILRAAASYGITNPDQLAYILATTEHETNFGTPRWSRSQTLVEDSNPLREGTNGWYASVHTNGRQVTGATREELEVNYWDAAYGGRLGNEAGTDDAARYRGRGFVQLTGRSNYENMTEVLGDRGFAYEIDGVTYGGPGGQPLDLAAHPEHVNQNPELAAHILVIGSMEGEFTGVSVPDYVNDSGSNFYDARSVINGDKETNGTSIANTAQGYAETLRNAGWGEGMYR